MKDVRELLWERRWCYWINEVQDIDEYGGYVPSIVVEGEAGHFPMLGGDELAAPWVWGKDLTKAQQIATKRNAARGLTAKDVTDILDSSVVASIRG